MQHQRRQRLSERPELSHRGLRQPVRLPMPCPDGMLRKMPMARDARAWSCARPDLPQASTSSGAPTAARPASTSFEQVPRLPNQPCESVIAPYFAEVAPCITVYRASASFSPAGGAMRPFRQHRFLDRQRALSPVDSVATRCIYGRALTISRIGDL